jgi:hypothetical protein
MNWKAAILGQLTGVLIVVFVVFLIAWSRGWV